METKTQSRLTVQNTPRINPSSKKTRSKDKVKKTKHNNFYGVRKNSLSRSLSDIPNDVAYPNTCYITPRPPTPVKTPCPKVLITEHENDDPDGSLKYKFIKAVKEIIKTRVQSPACRREYTMMKEERETTDQVGRPEIVIVRESHAPLRTIQSEPAIATFPFGADDNSDKVDGQLCQHDACIETSVIPPRKANSRLCMIKAVCRMKELASRRPKTIVELKRNPVTTADEKLMREMKESNTEDNADSESDSEKEPLAHLKSCRYLRGTQEDKELTMEEIFH